MTGCSVRAGVGGARVKAVNVEPDPGGETGGVATSTTRRPASANIGQPRASATTSGRRTNDRSRWLGGCGSGVFSSRSTGAVNSAHRGASACGPANDALPEAFEPDAYTLLA